MLSSSDYNNAVPQFTDGDYAGSIVSPVYIEAPDTESYERGVEPFETLPAQWWNWFGNQFTARFNKLNIYVKNIFNELTQLLSLVNITPDGTEETPTTEQLKTAFQTEYPKYLALLMYPVGSLYWTSVAPENGGNPNTLFGGTWVQIEDCFVWAKGANDTVNATGGSKTHKIVANELPTHTHSIGGTTGNEASHTHSMTHYHTRGTLRIQGSTGGNLITEANGETRGEKALRVACASSKNSIGNSGAHYWGYGTVSIDTDRTSSWTGLTSTCTNSSGTAITNTGAGSSHNHTLPANTGNNTTTASAMSIMPPYVIKYCWERTA